MIKNIDQFNYRNADFKDKSVIINCSFDVLDKKTGEISDEDRLYAIKDTVENVSKQAKTVVLIGHASRPKGEFKESLSLWNLKPWLEKNLELNTEIKFIEAEEDKLKRVNFAESGVYLIDNIRFFARENSSEESERKQFAEKLAGIADIYVNENFPSYREKPSTTLITNYLPSYLGSTFIDEAKALGEIIEKRSKTLAVIGGAKLSTKLVILENLLQKFSKVLLGGAMTYTFLKAKGIEIGKSMAEEDFIESAKKLIDKYGEKLVLPTDHLILDELKQPDTESDIEITESQEIPQGKIAVDIGPKTVEAYQQIISEYEKVVWNGPMGVFEWDYTDFGTKLIAETLSGLKKVNVTVGGGDTLAAIEKFDLKDFNHISIGGGAMLELIANDTLPTIESVMNQKPREGKNLDSDKKSKENSPSTPLDVLVIYGTHSGNAEETADIICETLSGEGLITETRRAELAEIPELKQVENFLVFVSSTYNVGKLNDKFVTLAKKLLKDEKLSLKDKKIALVALGDSAHYDIFAGAADELEELVEKIEAEKIGSSLKIDGSPFKSVQKIKDWSRKLV